MCPSEKELKPSFAELRWILTGLHFVLASLFGCRLYFDPVGILFRVVFGFVVLIANEHVQFGVWKIGFRDS